MTPRYKFPFKLLNNRKIFLQELTTVGYICEIEQYELLLKDQNMLSIESCNNPQ